MISTHERDIKDMEKAAARPELIVLSDWTQYNSDVYWKTLQDTNLLVL
jgi:hypothetical protein